MSATTDARCRHCRAPESWHSAIDGACPDDDGPHVDAPAHDEYDALEPIAGAVLRYDDDGRPIVEVATCGTCGRSWNDAAISSVTPAPSGRCPFEYDHDEPEREPTPAEQIAAQLDARDLDADRIGPMVSPDAMMAAAGHVSREYGYTGYRIGLVRYAQSSGGVFRVSHADGSTFYLVADRYENVARVADGEER